MKCLVLATVVLASVHGTAVADGEPWWFVVPPACVELVPSVADDHPMYWDQMLTLGACLQEPPTLSIEDEDRLPDALDQLAAGYAPALLLYGEVVAHAPDDVKLRAVYQIALASQSLVVRARSSLANEELRLPLEADLMPARQIAWLAFTIVVDAAASMRWVPTDAVGENMLRTARVMLTGYRDFSPEDRELQVWRAATSVRTLRNTDAREIGSVMSCAPSCSSPP